MKKYKFIQGADFIDEKISFEKGEVYYGKIKNPNEINENAIIVTIYKNGKSIDVPLKATEGLYQLKETNAFTEKESKAFYITILIALGSYGFYKYFKN